MFPVPDINVPQFDVLKPSQEAIGRFLANQGQEQKNKAQTIENRFAPQKAEQMLALLHAQTVQKIAQATRPFGGQTLTGPAGTALSDILFKKKFKDDPTALATLKNAHNAVDRSANARLFWAIPSNERALLIAKAKALGYDSQQAVQLFGRGFTLQDLANHSGAATNPIPSESNIAPTPSGANTATPDTHNAALADVQKQTSPIKWENVSPNFAPTESVRSRAQFAAQASAGLEYLGKYVGQNINYGGITSKITRPWLQDAYSSDPTSQQKAVNYYVAQAIKPELALLRIKIQGGQPSARAMSVIAPTILGHIQVDLANLPARIQRRVQVKAVDILNEAAYQSELQTLAPNPNVFNKMVQGSAPQNINSTVAAPSIKFSKGITMKDVEETAKIHKQTVAEVIHNLKLRGLAK